MKPDERDWSRWDGESLKAFRCFEAFLELGEDATLKAAAKRAKCPLRNAEYWSVKFAWVKRRSSHARYLSEQARKKSDHAIIASRVRHATMMQGTAQAMVRPIIELSRRIEKQTFDLAKLSDEKLTELVIRAGTALPKVLAAEREALGDVPGYMPQAPDQAPDETTRIVEEDDAARVLAARLIQRVGDVQQARLDEEVAVEAARRKKAEGDKVNTDWNGTMPSSLNTTGQKGEPE